MIDEGFTGCLRIEKIISPKYSEWILGEMRKELLLGTVKEPPQRRLGRRELFFFSFVNSWKWNKSFVNSWKLKNSFVNSWKLKNSFVNSWKLKNVLVNSWIAIHSWFLIREWTKITFIKLWKPFLMMEENHLIKRFHKKRCETRRAFYWSFTTSRIKNFILLVN